MSETVHVMPQLATFPCQTVRPESVQFAAGEQVDMSQGAFGVGQMVTPDAGPCLFFSIHLPDGDVAIARLPEDEIFRFMAVLSAELAALTGIPAEQLTH